MKINGKTKLQLQLHKALFVVLLILAASGLAWISHSSNLQFDWTRNSRNSLTQSSIDLLKTLDSPVTVNVYVSEDTMTRSAIIEIFDRYKNIKDDFNVHLINPDLDIEKAQHDGITQYGQVVVKYKDRKEIITSISESTLTNTLVRLSRDNKTSVVFLSGHGERDTFNASNIGYSKLASELNTSGIETSSKNLLESPLDADTDVLVIAAPDNSILPGELTHIKKYLQDGGNLLWMMDPGSLHGLEALSSMLDIKFHDGVIVDNNANLRNTLGIQHPAVIPVIDYYPHAITKNIDYNTLFPISRGLTINNNTGWKSFIIAQSLPKSWSESSGLQKEVVFDSNEGDVAGPVSIVVALERRSEKDSTNKNQRVVIAGDSDFLANNYIGIGANLKLGMNILNWLSKSDELIAIDLKQSGDTQLKLTDSQVLIISLGFLIVLPLILLSSGLIIWYKRRKL